MSDKSMKISVIKQIRPLLTDSLITPGGKKFLISAVTFYFEVVGFFRYSTLFLTDSI